MLVLLLATCGDEPLSPVEVCARRCQGDSRCLEQCDPSKGKADQPAAAAGSEAGAGAGCDECQAAATSCQAGGELRVCEKGADGCHRWSAARRCPEHQACANGACACQDACQQGEQSCDPSGSAWRSCAADAAGCRHWGPSQPCKKKMVCGAAAGSCQPDTPAACLAVNECDFDGEIVCTAPGKYRLCKKGGNGCLALDCAT
jgi:hypothetical protein